MKKMFILTNNCDDSGFDKVRSIRSNKVRSIDQCRIGKKVETLPRKVTKGKTVRWW